MIIIDYNKKNHQQIIHACVTALVQGKSVVYPTDTSYGLGVDATNIKAVKKLYQIKERNFNKPVHVVVPSVAYAKKIADWNAPAIKLAKNFWPGAVTIILTLKVNDRGLKMLSAGTKSIGLRRPKNQIALDLAEQLGSPITATSANPSAHLSGGFDSYSAADVVAQFKNHKFLPDIIINAGRLPKRKPSTLVRAFDDVIKVLREGPITEKQILKSLLNTKGSR